MVRVRAATSTTRPSRPCCITTRLASHARRRDVSYETSPSSRHLFDEHDVVAQAFQATNVVTPRAVGIAVIKVADPKIVMSNAVLQHVPERDHHGVLHGHDRFFGTAPRLEPVVERTVVLFRLRTAAQATSCRVARSHVAPLPVVVGRRFPALSLLPGQSRAQEAKCPAVGNWLMSTPVSAMIAWAARAATPGMVCASVASSANGAIAASMRVSSVAI
jgi:hypothetical protein